MAYERPNPPPYTVPASADLSTKQFFPIVIDSSGEAVVAGADVFVDGILQNKPSAQGVEASIASPGSISKVEIGTGGATVGVYAKAVADGAADASATDIIIGMFLVGGAAGAIGTILLVNMGAVQV